MQNRNSNSERHLELLLQCGQNRLLRAASGENFFQAAPSAKPDANLPNWYLQNFGQIINTDCAKLAFLTAGYCPTQADSVAAFHPQASALVRQLIDEMFIRINDDSTICFMAGGNGAGKSTFCNGAKDALDNNDWIIDATLASYDAAAETMERILAKANPHIALIFIDRPMSEAWENGVLKRAAHGSHRTPREVFEMTHAIVGENVDRLYENFKSQGLLLFKIKNTPIQKDFAFCKSSNTT